MMVADEREDWAIETLAVFANAGNRYIYLKNLERYLKISFAEARSRSDRLEQLGYLESRPGEFGPVFRLSQRGRTLAEESGLTIRETERIDAKDPGQRALKEQLRAQAEQAKVDPRTGLWRQEVFDRELIEALEQARASNTPCAVLLIDLDHFKSVNDSHGHSVGNEVLAAVGEVLRRVVGSSGECYRYGGDEMTVILPGRGATEAVALAENVKSEIERIRISIEGLAITASIGVAAFPEQADSSRQLVELSDRAMYQAKAVRNTVRLFRG